MAGGGVSGRETLRAERQDAKVAREPSARPSPRTPIIIPGRLRTNLRYPKRKRRVACANLNRRSASSTTLRYPKRKRRACLSLEKRAASIRPDPPKLRAEARGSPATPPAPPRPTPRPPNVMQTSHPHSRGPPARARHPQVVPPPSSAVSQWHQCPPRPIVVASLKTLKSEILKYEIPRPPANVMRPPPCLQRRLKAHYPTSRTHRKTT
jgi:hypothetical protein